MNPKNLVYTNCIYGSSLKRKAEGVLWCQNELKFIRYMFLLALKQSNLEKHPHTKWPSGTGSASVDS